MDAKANVLKHVENGSSNGRAFSMKKEIGGFTSRPGWYIFFCPKNLLLSMVYLIPLFSARHLGCLLLQFVWSYMFALARLVFPLSHFNVIWGGLAINWPVFHSIIVRMRLYFTYMVIMSEFCSLRDGLGLGRNTLLPNISFHHSYNQIQPISCSFYSGSYHDVLLHVPWYTAF